MRPLHFAIKTLAEIFNFTPAYRLQTSGKEKDGTEIRYSQIFLPWFYSGGEFEMSAIYLLESQTDLLRADGSGEADVIFIHVLVQPRRFINLDPPCVVSPGVT
jgi:hypothetical protein